MSDRLLRTHKKKESSENTNTALGPVEETNTGEDLSPTLETIIDNVITNNNNNNNNTNNNKEVLPKINPPPRPSDCSADYALHRTQILDPLSVIINLAIMSYKPIKTKISIANNCVNIQENGMFQALVRSIFRDTKYNLPLLYNPIEFACEHFLDKAQLKKLPKIKMLFERAIVGLENICETYVDDSVIKICLNYYMSLIQNFLGDSYDEMLFKTDAMTRYYNTDLVKKLNERWTSEKLQVIAEMNQYLVRRLDPTNNVVDGVILTGIIKMDNVMCMETFMRDIDAETVRIIYSV